LTYNVIFVSLISFVIFIFRTIVTAVNAYTQNVTLISYATAGLIVGGISRISFGMKGFIVGSTLGKLHNTDNVNNTFVKVVHFINISNKRSMI